MAKITVQSLHVYPVKSLQGVQRSSSTVEARGLQFDRRWMLVDPDGGFLTQRTFARMATIGVRLGEEGLTFLSEGEDDFFLPYALEGDKVKVKVWSFEGKAMHLSDEADRWFSRALETPTRLVRMPPTTKRSIHPGYGKGEIAFSDAMPILVASQESLDLLNSRLAEPLPMNRFRANVIVRGATPHAEDQWSRIRIGDTVLRRTKKCGRCLVTTTDQETGERGVEPLRALADYRKEGNVVYFGCYYVPEQIGTISVGDEIALEE